MARGGFLECHVKVIRRVHGERLEAMLAALSRHFSEEATWTRPEGGLFLWVTLPEGFDSRRLFDEALKEKVAFVPGTPFSPNGGGLRTLRLNFSYCTPEVIEEGIRRLGGVVARKMPRRLVAV